MELDPEEGQRETGGGGAWRRGGIEGLCCTFRSLIVDTEEVDTSDEYI